VEEVAQPHHACCFAREIRHQTRGAAAEHTGYRVQFLAAIAQIIPSRDEIGRAQRGACRKQNAVLAIPKPVIGGRFRECSRLNGRYCWDRLHGARLRRCSKLKQCIGNLLRQTWLAKTQNGQNNSRSRFQRPAKPG